ncbi:MAG: hypothetical protein AAGF88_05330 [Pseudomonadota bacterium]
MRIWLFFVALVLPASVAAGPGVFSVPTGVTAAHSDHRVVSSHIRHAVIAEARVVFHGVNRVFIVELAQRSGGNRPRIDIDRAISGQATLDFEPSPRIEAFCPGNGRCIGYHLGTVFFSEAAFEQAANAGMAMRLTGPGTALELSLPPALFAEARDQALLVN